MTIDQLNRLNETQACEAFEQCCGASRWVDRMVVGRPYEDLKEMLAISDAVWEECDVEDYLESFSRHQDVFAASSSETDVELLRQLKELHAEYQEKFGHSFVFCAPGRSAADVLRTIQQRSQNEPEKEVLIAAAEQNKFTHMRLKKLLHIGANTIV
jgi:2-oxo-4-hydroxy-4-carboxy-5-ureidoimidazoline decarboxylase